MTDDPLLWRVEAACLQAWPSPVQIVAGGWQLRTAGGPTRRANSANMLRADADMDAAQIDLMEAYYTLQGRPALVRVTDMARQIDPLLAARGYALDAPTRTLFAEMDGLALDDAPRVQVRDAPDAAWMTARDRLSGNDPGGCAAYRAVIGSILLPCGFAAMPHDGRIAAIAFGAMRDGLLILESVMTDPSLRRLGLARQCLHGLLRWARVRGVEAVALQVAADNLPALALYRGLGFEGELYGYHYRIRREG